MLGTAQGVRIGITGLGVHVPAKIVTNAELAELVETSDEWIRERTGIRERRIASQDEALTDIAMPAAVAALADAAAALVLTLPRAGTYTSFSDSGLRANRGDTSMITWY